MIGTKRNLWVVIFLILITFGFYCFYWLVVTKTEMNIQGAKIPTSWLLIVPFVMFYYLYQWAYAFATLMLKSPDRTIGYFVLLSLLLPIGVVICQHDINKIDTVRI